MNTNPTSHHVTSGNRVVYVTVIRIDPAAVKAVVQTHPYKEDIETSPTIDPAAEIAVVQTHPYKEDLATSPTIDPVAAITAVQSHLYNQRYSTTTNYWPSCFKMQWWQLRAIQSTQSLPEHITITWFFAAVEAEAPVLSCVVMGTSNPVKNTAIGTLEYDWSIKIVHKLCR